MKLKELKAIIDDLYARREGACRGPDYPDDLEILITTASGGMGARSACGIKNIQEGFDWEHGQLRIEPEKPMVIKSDKEQVFDMAREMLMWLATKPVKRKSYEILMAQKIMEKYYPDYMKFQHLYHPVVK